MYFFLLSLIPHFVVLPVAAIFSLWMFLPSIDPHWYDIDVWSFQWLTSSFFLIQMLAQDQSARDAESLVINNFNTKLVAKISSFKSNNTGVNSFLLCWPFMCVGYSIYDLFLRSQPTFGTLTPNSPRFWTLPLLMGLKMPRPMGVDLTCFGGASFLVFLHTCFWLNYLFFSMISATTIIPAAMPTSISVSKSVMMFSAAPSFK